MTLITELGQFRRVQLRKPMQRAIDNDKNLLIQKYFEQMVELTIQLMITMTYRATSLMTLITDLGQFRRV